MPPTLIADWPIQFDEGNMFVVSGGSDGKIPVPEASLSSSSSPTSNNWITQIASAAGECELLLNRFVA
jgi:hypothetical protein